jgi:hypothetical protein
LAVMIKLARKGGDKCRSPWPLFYLQEDVSSLGKDAFHRVPLFILWPTKLIESPGQVRGLSIGKLEETG